MRGIAQSFLGIALAIAGTTMTSNAGAEAAGDASLFPPTTYLYAELSDPVELISTILDHPLVDEVVAMEPYQLATQSPQYQQFLAGREMVEDQIGMPWREGLETLFANGVTVGVDSASGNAFCVVVHGKDSDSMKMMFDKAMSFAKMNPKIEYGSYRDVGAFRIDGNRVAVIEDRMLFTNSSDLGKQVIDRILDGGESLADNERFQQALTERDTRTAGWGFVDVEFIRGAGKADQVITEKINNPVGELLVGGIQSTLQETPFATVELFADGKALGLKLAMPFQREWIPEEREYFFGPSGTGHGPAIPELDETLFTLSTHRDFSEVWLRAGDLFNADINDGFAKADATLTTFFAGRDFGEDILGAFESEAAFVATRQDFSTVSPTPTIKLPAFALMFELKQPDKMTRDLRRNFQNLIGFLNVVGAMNGQSQLEMDMEQIDDDVRLVTSEYVPEEDEVGSTDARILYNFSPSIGFAGERFVVASTEDLARKLALAPSPDPATIADNTHAVLRANTLRHVLADNQEQLIAQNMLEDGNSREEAEAIIGLLLQVVGYFEDASLRLGSRNDQLEAELQVRVKQ